MLYNYIGALNTSIAKFVVPVPVNVGGTLSYNGSVQSPIWDGYDDSIMELVSGGSGTNAGTYTAIFSFKDPNKYMWNDKSTGNKGIDWEIERATVTTSVPTQSNTLTYNGNVLSPTWTNYNTSQLQIGGDVTGTDAGTYNVTFTPTSNYKWSDGTIDSVSATWSIGYATISTTPSQSETLYYTGSIVYPTWNYYNDTQLEMSGVSSATDAGTYTATFTPTENYKWFNGTKNPVDVSWTITSALISLTPTQSGSLVYNGEELSPTWENYNSLQLTIGGTTVGTNAGNYTASFTPTENYQWSNYTTTAKNVSWSIQKASSNVSVEPTSISLDADNLTEDITIYRNGTGAITVTSSNTSVAIVELTGTVATVSGVKTGEATITISVAEDDNHTESSITVSVVSNVPTMYSVTANIVPENTGTVSGIGVYLENSNCTLVANPVDDYKFVNWQKTALVTITDNPYTFQVTEDVNLTANFASLVTTNVFGVMWDYANSSTALTRLTSSNDPNSYVTNSPTSEPVPAVGTDSGSSPFDDYMPWKGMEEYNIIDGNVSYKQGESGFSRTNYDTMVYIPEFWYKIVDDSTGSKRYFYVSDGELDGFNKHPGSGKYVSRYTANSSYKSVSGNQSVVNITRATGRTNARNKGTGWQLYDFSSYCALILLYVVEYADWNSQAVIGRGYVDSNYAQINTGATDSMTYHTGRAAGTDGKTAIQYRHIENMWGNIYQFVDGINFNYRQAYVCLDPTKYADNTAESYIDTGITLPSSDGYIKGLGYSSNNDWLIIPNASGGTDSTYIPDYIYSGTGRCVLCCGGVWDNASSAGAACFLCYYDSTSASTFIGVRLLYNP